MKAWVGWVCGVGILASLPAARGHHSYSMFDSTRHAQVRGTIKAVEWVSPHVWIFVTADTADAQATTYGFETASPGQLLRDFGWSRHSIHVGDKVTVEYAPLRSGRAGGGLTRLTLADGTVLTTRFANAAEAGRASAPNQLG